MIGRRRITPHLEGQRLGGIRALAWAGVVLMAGAALLWFLAGGRGEFVAGMQTATWRVLVPAAAFWLAWVLWLVAGVWFAIKMFRSIMGRLDDSWTRPGGGGGPAGKRGQ
ncbi:hypothetical protein GCM10023063_14060 [Arthrobacter methylotrophus]|uniref:Uncharacterized protein n=1 Tax=Arthrobacter methylotrophus TaxID=121291 RepID=A0ABV5UXC8_9MICC